MLMAHVDASGASLSYVPHQEMRPQDKGMGMSFKVSFDNPSHLISEWRSSSGGDTGSNESGHRWTKTATTEKGRHIQQSDRRHAQIHLMRWQWKKLADDPLWQYLDGYEHPEARSLKVAPPTTGGSVSVQNDRRETMPL
jgi:hypothetical protein